MAYLPNFRHDIFVSYAHGPTGPGFGGGVGEARLGLWTRRLIDQLGEEIKISLGTRHPDRQCSVWMDPTLKGNEPLTDTLRARISDSALLVVVMSDFFLESPWCLEEVEWFRRSCSRRGVTPNGRIFVIRAFATDGAKWPRGLKDSAGHSLTGYRFHPRPVDDHERPRPYCWNDPQMASPELAAAMEQLSGDICRQLNNPEMSRDPHEAVSSPSKRRKVFLGFAHDTLDEERAELRQALVSEGIDLVPPPEEEPEDEQSLNEAIERYLPSADAMVLIANEYRGAWPKNQPGGFVSLQIQKAKEQNKRCDLWLKADDLSRVKKPDYRQFLEALCNEAKQNNIPLQYADATSFAQATVKKLSEVVEPGAGVQAFDLGDAVICTNRPEDMEVADNFLETVKATLSELRQESFTFDFADPEKERVKLTNLERRIRRASTVLVLCFDQNWDWAQPFLKLLNGMSNVRSADKVRLLVAGPRDRNEARYDARALGFATLDGVDKDANELRSLLMKALERDGPRIKSVDSASARA